MRETWYGTSLRNSHNQTLDSTPWTRLSWLYIQSGCPRFRSSNQEKGQTTHSHFNLKRSIVEVKAEENCLAHALIIAIAKVDNNPNYTSYRNGRKIRPVVRNQLVRTRIVLSGDWGSLKSLDSKNFRDCKITVYQGLDCVDIIFEVQVDSLKHINLLYEDVERHYHLIANLRGAMVRRYVCKAFKKQDVGETLCTCSDCMPSPPCAFSTIRITCAECNKHFRTQALFANHKHSTPYKNPSVNAGDVALRVGHSRRAEIRNVMSDISKSVTRKEM